MNEELQKNLKTRAKEILKIEEECSYVELYERLREYRKHMHPDKFADDETKKEAKEKFQEIQDILEELKRAIDKERLEKKSTEIQYYQSNYDNVELEKKIDDVNAEKEKLEDEIKKLERTKENLEEEISNREENNLKEDIKNLEASYKPSKINLASFGVTFVLSTIFTIFSQIENITEKIKIYAPMQDAYIDKLIFWIFIILLIINIKILFERNYIKRRANEICSPIIISKFMGFLNGKEIGSVDEFKEMDVYEYLAGDDSKIKNILKFFGFRIYYVETINNLKDIFIDNLLRKKFITISSADKLDRTFRIKKKGRFY